jgi:hypothetical protein
MRVLFRVATALLIAFPILLVLVIVFVLAGRRGASLPRESGHSPSLERGAWAGPSLPASKVAVGVSR